MARCLVTGVAGFIGSHLAEQLIRTGHHVVGVDAFTSYYPERFKRANLTALNADSSFELIEANLLDLQLGELMADVEYVFHEAAQAGVRACWGDSFSTYVDNNILGTQRLLEAAKDAKLRKFVFASTSSIYGDAESDGTPETAVPNPISPYGVSKLAAEHLCRLYGLHFHVPTIILRYFTVYGPRQRPDMAFHKFIKAMLCDEDLALYGDGNQSRDFTYIDDIVAANMLAMDSDVSGEVMNIGGGSRVTINETLSLLSELTGVRPRIQYLSQTAGEVRRTAADISKAKQLLSYQPQYRLRDGLRKEVEWLSGLYETRQPATAAASRFSI